ncbi:uncharacterized sugar kinase YeiI-like [Musca vetustissima]|uniref:uncharacterized sugar kinase YeiI-like n=1 Tax=Musca vetustissima TaxID=27455 RepID=UPI002AB7B212|nr:uncharacterized sugar kinase YeiI-like [Musca vetustissima]
MENKEEEKLPVVIGASIFDIKISICDDDIPITMDGAMYKGKQPIQTAGGVGKNLAESIYKLYGKINFISVIGDDIMGESLLQLLPEALRCNVEKMHGYPTASRTTIVDKNGDVKLKLCDMEIYNVDMIRTHTNLLYLACVIIIDGHLPVR